MEAIHSVSSHQGCPQDPGPKGESDLVVEWATPRMRSPKRIWRKAIGVSSPDRPPIRTAGDEQYGRRWRWHELPERVHAVDSTQKGWASHRRGAPRWQHPSQRWGPNAGKRCSQLVRPSLTPARPMEVRPQAIGATPRAKRCMPEGERQPRCDGGKTCAKAFVQAIRPRCRVMGQTCTANASRGWSIEPGRSFRSIRATGAT